MVRGPARGDDHFVSPARVDSPPQPAADALRPQRRGGPNAPHCGVCPLPERTAAVAAWWCLASLAGAAPPGDARFSAACGYFCGLSDRQCTNGSSQRRRYISVREARAGSVGDAELLANARGVRVDDLIDEALDANDDPIVRPCDDGEECGISQ